MILQVYDEQVDLFSFGMFLYELLTLHIPYELLAIHQANQANERGTRPSLSKRDFPCPVLVREMMVWCWQQSPDQRPTAREILDKASQDQFPRLLDGIRVCTSGLVIHVGLKSSSRVPYSTKFSRPLNFAVSVILAQSAKNLSTNMN